MTARLMSTALAWASALAAGCWSESPNPGGGSVECGGFNCEDILAIHVERRDGEPLSPGEYRFSFDDGAASIICSIGSDGDMRCDGDYLEAILSDDKDELTLRTDETWPRFSLEVFHEGNLVGSEQLAPEYTIISSVDPECDLTCLQGSATVQIGERDSTRDSI